MPVDPAAIPPLTPAMAAVARPLQGVSCPLVPEALAAGDRRLLMRAMLELAPIAHTSTDFEYTLKRLLGAMGDLLDLDFIGYIDLDGATNYGLARLPGPRSRAQEFTARTHEILGWLCPSGQGSCPAVIWNRRILATDGPDGEGVWMPLQSWALGQLRGFYLLRFAQPPLTSPTALRALITECDLVLNAPYLLRQQGWTAEDTSERFNAIKEMLGLFRDIDNPDFCLEYLLILMECCRVDRGALWELGPDREIIGSLGVGLPQALLNDMTVSGQVPLVEQVLEQGRPVWIEGPDLLVSAAGHGSEGGVASHVHAFTSLLAFPLVGSSGPAGVVALLDLEGDRHLDGQFMGMVGNIAATYLEAAGRQRKLLSTKDLEHQVSVAHDIQVALLPSNLAAVEGCEVAAASNAAKMVGGDFFHFHRDGGRLQATIGDVSGKGVAAGMLMTMTRVLFDTHCKAGLDPSQMLALINETLVEQTPADRFVTAFHLRFDPAAGTMECWNAGHDPLLVLRANGQLESVNPDGMILGVVRGVLFPSITVPLEPGDTALLFTDGLPESMDPVRNLFGEHRIERVLRETQGQPAQAVLEALLAAARRFAAGTPQHDDTTLIVLRATGTPRAAGPAVPTLQTQESRA